MANRYEPSDEVWELMQIWFPQAKDAAILRK